MNFKAALKGFIDGWNESIRDSIYYIGIFGFLGNIASGLWNGVKGAVGGFFGRGGEVTVTGPPAVAAPAPAPVPKQDNTLLYVGLGVGVLMIVVVLVVTLKK